MFKRRTLFVIGAGASNEVEFPVGAELATAIASLLNLRMSDGELRPAVPNLFAQLRKAHGADVIASFHKIHQGVILSNSIDDFLHIHRKDPLVVKVGKAAIVRAILDAESRSKLFVDHSNIYNVPAYRDFSGTWYVKLMRVLGAMTDAEDAPQALDNLSFIVFNYDRCLEHFLRFAICHLYAIPKAQAEEIVRSATIIHPYGLIGTLDEVPYGGVGDRSENYIHLSNRIKTYTEQLGEGDTIEAVKREMAVAEAIVFLGFAFHAQNLDLLEPREPILSRQVFATAFGMSDDDASVVKAVLAEWFPEESYEGETVHLDDHIRVENKLKCAELFDYYSKSIAK